MKAKRIWLTTGTIVGNYVIDARLAASGAGEVYLAKDLATKSKVALKLLPLPNPLTTEALSALVHQMNRKVKLQHPLIAETYDIGITPTGQLFIASEYVHGHSFDTLLQAGMTFDAEWVAQQVGNALEFAHECGRIHGDLKCSDLMLTADGQIKVLDFDLAEYKAFCWRYDADTFAELPPSHVRHYTPEHVHGLTITPQSDLFSLGTILYELVTGAAAFTGGNTLEVNAAILWNQPEAINVYAPEISSFLKALIEGLLAKDQAVRTPSASALLASLYAAQEEAAQAVTTLERLSRRKQVVQQFFSTGDGQMIADFIGKGVWQYMVNDGALLAVAGIVLVLGYFAFSTLLALIHAAQ